MVPNIRVFCEVSEDCGANTPNTNDVVRKLVLPTQDGTTFAEPPPTAKEFAVSSLTVLAFVTFGFENSLAIWEQFEHRHIVVFHWSQNTRNNQKPPVML